MAAFAVFFVVLRLIIGYFVQSSMLGTGTENQMALRDAVGRVLLPSARNETGDPYIYTGPNVNVIGDIAVSYLYAVGVILLVEPLMYQSARRADALLRVFMGLPQTNAEATGPVELVVKLTAAAANTLLCTRDDTSRSWDRSAGVRSQLTSSAGMHADLRGSSMVTLGGA